MTWQEFIWKLDNWDEYVETLDLESMVVGFLSGVCLAGFVWIASL